MEEMFQRRSRVMPPNTYEDPRCQETNYP
jgi:hypothetical protein